MLLSPLVPRFLEAFAHVPLEVALDAEQLADGAWDVAIRTRPPADGSVTQRLLGAPPALLCATPAYLQQRGTPERPDDLRTHDLLTPDAAELPRVPPAAVTRGAQRAEVPLSPKLAVDDPAVLHAATAAGLGIGLLPEFLCRQGLATGRLKARAAGVERAAGGGALCAVSGRRSSRIRARSSSWTSWPRTSSRRSRRRPRRARSLPPGRLAADSLH